MNDRTFVTITRLWKQPRIYTSLTDSGIGIRMDLDDFREALKQELGSVAFVFTRAEISKRIDEAFLKILSGMKEETIKVI